MTTYAMPELRTRPEPASATVYAVASGDLRLAANTTCWPAQQAFEEQVRTAFATHGWAMERAHDVDPVTGHGFIDSQARGIEVFRSVPKDAPVVVVDAVWQYSHHVLAGLRAHRGPILIVANWSGQFPGLVGLLNLTASLTKAKIEHSILWSRDFTDEWALGKLREWIETGTIEHETPHVRDLPALRESDEARLGSALAEQLRDDHAIIDDEMLNPTGIYKERLSQSALLAEMARVPAEEADAALAWLEEAGLTFHWGEDDATELTREQVLSQMRMYIAALRIGDDYGVDAIGIQYQQGLKDQCAASDLAEGLLNKQIADRLGVQERTVKAHLTAIFERLEVRNRTQASVVLRELELSDPARQI